jgi:hypothetical protein
MGCAARGPTILSGQVPFVDILRRSAHVADGNDADANGIVLVRFYPHRQQDLPLRFALFLPPAASESRAFMVSLTSWNLRLAWRGASRLVWRLCGL